LVAEEGGKRKGCFKSPYSDTWFEGKKALSSAKGGKFYQWSCLSEWPKRTLWAGLQGYLGKGEKKRGESPSTIERKVSHLSAGDLKKRDTLLSPYFWVGKKGKSFFRIYLYLQQTHVKQNCMRSRRQGKKKEKPLMRALLEELTSSEGKKKKREPIILPSGGGGGGPTIPNLAKEKKKGMRGTAHQ